VQQKRIIPKREAQGGQMFLDKVLSPATAMSANTTAQRWILL
jgi:hypothetical protein